MDLIDRTISFRNRKTEISYHHIQQEYNQIQKFYGNLSNISIDFSFSAIKQNTLDRVMKDLFMIYEIEDERFQHKFHFLENLTINVYSTLFTNIDFIQYFEIYRNIKTITIECEQNMALSVFNITKSMKKIEKIICSSYFTKQFGVYTIESNTLISELDFNGVEDQIVSMKTMIESNNLERFLDLFSKASSLTDLDMMIISLQDFSKDFKSIMKTLSTNAMLLSKLHILLYIDELVPPIKKESFKSPLTLSVDYQYPLTHLDIKGILRKVHKFADQNDSLNINPNVNYHDYNLKLSFQKQILDENELKELIKFISKCNNKLLGIQIEFHPNQQMTNKQWVNIINHLGSYEELKKIRITGTDVSISIVALSVAKLMKCRKTDIFIKGQTFSNNNLDLQLFQISDYTLQVIFENVFDAKSSRVQCLVITAYQLMGDIKPLSKYLSQSKYTINQLKITITSNCDALNYFFNIIQDKRDIHRFVGSFSFVQQKSLVFNSSDLQIQAQILQDYNSCYSFESINEQVLTKKFATQLFTLLRPLRNFLSDLPNDFERYVELFNVFIHFRKVLEVYKYQRTQPTIMLAFYTLIGPQLLNNPYQIYTDLYYD